MSEHHASLLWSRGETEFTYDAYPRAHVWTFLNGATLEASAAPEFRGDPDRVDPEAAFVASLSSCHMLTFLALAARKRIVVDRYEDDAVGVLEKNDAGRMAVTRVTLRPRVTFVPGAEPSAEQLEKLHERAHHECFLANSVQTVITVQARS